MFDTILETIGNTPLLKIGSINPHPCEIWVKLEGKNPGGSIKDRVVIYSLQRAYAKGKINSNTVIVEPSSGNTGIALAMVAAVYKMRCIITMPENMTIERQKLMSAYGAEIVLTPASEGMAGAVRRAEEIHSSTANAFMLGQFTNSDMVDAHYRSTGPEIFSEFGDNIHALVAGVGTGGTISGTGLYLKERIEHLNVYAVEPFESPMISQGISAPHGIQGIGPNFISAILNQNILHDVITVKSKDAIDMRLELFKQEGISCGISSGANICAALQIASLEHMAGKRIVTFICDTGERYLNFD